MQERKTEKDALEREVNALKDKLRTGHDLDASHFGYITTSLLVSMGSAIILAGYPNQENRIDYLTKMHKEARDSLRHYLALIRNFPEFARA